MRKILAKTMTILFLLGLTCLLFYAVCINVGQEGVWFILSVIGSLTLGSFLSLFVDWLFEDKDEKNE